MNSFQKRTAFQIASVSIVLASLASPVAWFVERERSEEGIVALAIEESGRLLHHYDAVDLSGPNALEHAALAAKTISGGMFDIAEIYDPQGEKLAESLTKEGAAVESSLPKHGRPIYNHSSYESLRLPGDAWILRVFVPLRESISDHRLPITGYFEGVRLVPQWQRDQIRNSSLTVALMVCLASLLCGAVLYPVVVRLSADNERKTREVLDSHISMMEALGRAIAKRDSDTGAHNYRVAWIAASIAEKMGFERPMPCCAPKAGNSHKTGLAHPNSALDLEIDVKLFSVSLAGSGPFESGLPFSQAGRHSLTSGLLVLPSSNKPFHGRSIHTRPLAPSSYRGSPE